MKALIVDETGRTSHRLEPALAQEGYLVRTAQQRGEALWLASENAPDVIVVCSATGSGGASVVAALREDGENAPALVMARRGASAELVDVLDAGADDVVTSPVPFPEVAARLRALTRRAPDLVEPDLQIGTLRLDRGARVAVRTPEVDSQPRIADVEYGGVDGDHTVDNPTIEPTVISLTTREYAVLELLMRHAGQVVTRARIVDEVWGGLDAVTSNLVDQVVSHLRRKLDRPFGRADITTVRGVGYRLVDSRRECSTGSVGTARRPRQERVLTRAS